MIRLLAICLVATPMGCGTRDGESLDGGAHDSGVPASCSVAQDHSTITANGLSLTANSITAFRDVGFCGCVFDVLRISTSSDACAQHLDWQFGDGGATENTWLEIQFASPPRVGQYSTDRAVIQPFGLGAALVQYAAGSQSQTRQAGATGTVTLTRVDFTDGAKMTPDQRLEGSFDLTFGSGQRLVGPFSTPFCNSCFPRR